VSSVPCHTFQVIVNCLLNKHIVPFDLASVVLFRRVRLSLWEGFSLRPVYSVLPLLFHRLICVLVVVCF
jgi:hypothetical protein